MWRGAIVLLLLVKPALMLLGPRAPGVAELGVVLFSSWPSTSWRPASRAWCRGWRRRMRGAALGVYNTLQSLGLFTGGALGGALLKGWGVMAVFGVTALLVAAWLLLGWGQTMPEALPHR